MKNFLRNSICLFFLGLSFNIFSQIYIDHEATGMNNGSSWTDAYNDLTEAIHASAQGDQLWIADGTYFPGNGTQIRDTFFTLPHDLEIYGGFDGSEINFNERDIEGNIVILSGDYNENDIDNNFVVNKSENALHVMYIKDHITRNTVLDGITIAYGITDDLNDMNDRGYAGGILIYGSPIISNCTFEQNYGDLGGGLCFLGDVSQFSDIRNCTFSENRALGGAGLYTNRDKILIDSCQFNANNAEFDGGGVFDNRAGIIVNNSSFNNNTSLDDAGAIYVLNASTKINNCLFNFNSGLEGAGGALTIVNFDSDTTTTPTFNNCYFDTNIARFGGACSIRFGVDASFVNCTFEGNEGEWVGGGLFVQGGAKIVIDSCKLVDNESEEGGAIASNNSDTSITINNSVVEGNKADIGGGFYMQNRDSGVGDPSELKIDRCSISGNTSHTNGGGINTLNTHLEVSNSLFFDNLIYAFDANGGAISINATNTSISSKIINTTFYGNSSMNGLVGGITQYTEEAFQSVLKLQNNIFSNSSGMNYSYEGDFAIVNSDGGNLSDDLSMENSLVANNDTNNEDPIFIDAENLNFNLNSNSPCIDTGIEINAPTTDILGNPRLGIVDKGAFEFQGMVGLKDILGARNQLKVFPNPAEDFLSIKLENTWKGKLFLQITDSYGRLVHQESSYKSNDLIESTLDIKNLSPGIYTLSIKSDNKVLSDLFVKH